VRHQASPDGHKASAARRRAWGVRHDEVAGTSAERGEPPRRTAPHAPYDGAPEPSHPGGDEPTRDLAWKGLSRCGLFTHLIL
jgi:hypothetical protein